MLSKMCKTAIKAVIFLCSQTDKDAYVGIKQIADAINSSEHTVGKILQSLVKGGIINSIKGPSGGFFITEAQGSLPLIKIVEAIDGREKFTECGLGLSKCSASHPCPIHHLYEPIRNGMERVFREKKVCDLCHRVNMGEAYLAG
ncbi:MAG TPA: Rrf2 family transcriptional regulator [Ginsengibacter sp.]|nr:Rrf2 family transcriptional regulator [Chitinophagaceae bacterium]MCW5913114.1 Rrf2 family transcriptional regulator [Chitinophagaceae bacterium]MCZ2396911.1 Rrf2 family transcriptional regulator [Chitinophagales bacterium]HRP44142.1 Rrf2 family transcriptional regulator [Ginsengibacter sp.]